jgi:hypothetical protein
MARREADGALGIDPLTDEELLGLFAGAVSEDVLERLLLAPPVPSVPTAPPPSPPSASPETRAREAARRLARVIVDDIRLYNAEQVAEGRRRHDLYARLKDAIERAFALWRERVPPDIPEAATALSDTLVAELALGDHSRFGAEVAFPLASPDPPSLLRLDVSDDVLPLTDLAPDEHEALLRASEVALGATPERASLGPRFDAALRRLLERFDAEALSITTRATTWPSRSPAWATSRRPWPSSIRASSRTPNARRSWASSCSPAACRARPSAGSRGAWMSCTVPGGGAPRRP